MFMRSEGFLMSEKSLLQKAARFAKAAGSELSSGTDFVFDKDSGISKEDQKDILLHIDTVAKSSRIVAGPETWKVRPKKRGIALPLVVNLAGALVLAGGLYGLGLVFAPSEESFESSSAQLASAEGRLLQEIKRETEGRIQEKDKEIAAIQQRMASLDSERDELLSSVDARIKAKETELKDQLKLELDRERQRLIDEGLSQTDVQERMREFEKRKTEEFKSQLDGFAKKAEEEKAALQSRLDKARDEYRTSLSAATTERQRIQDESRQREQDLRAQLDDKNKALEAERARTADSLKGAQAELTRFNQDAARVKAVEDRLVGLYASARQSLRDGRLDDAAATLDSLRAYLADPQVAGVPTLQARRELDLFAVELIERSINSERSKTSADTSRVTAALDALAVVRNEVERARAAIAAGDPAAAMTAYRRALSATSELKEAGAFIEGNGKAMLDAKVAELEAATLAAQTAAVEAKVALGAVEAAARDEKALEAAFVRLLSSLPLGPGDASRVYSFIKTAGAREAVAAGKASDTASAGVPFRAAAADLSAGRYFEAIQGFATVLARYPAAGQVPRAVEGLRDAGGGLVVALQEARDKAAERIAELESRLAAARNEVPEPIPGTATATTAPGAAGSTIPTAELVALQQEKSRLESELETARMRYEAVASAYRAYGADEEAILARGGDLALVEAKAKLDAFLSSPAVSSAMPGMRDRIARYLAAFQTAGQKEVLFNAADIVDGAARIRDAATRGRYFSDLEKRNAGNQSMLEFIDSVRQTFR
jgi:hypothetical protein